eukprot:365062-Chlamydomonas_euryale.AAC.11
MSSAVACGMQDAHDKTASANQWRLPLAWPTENSRAAYAACGRQRRMYTSCHLPPIDAHAHWDRQRAGGTTACTHPADPPPFTDPHARRHPPHADGDTASTHPADIPPSGF